MSKITWLPEWQADSSTRIGIWMEDEGLPAEDMYSLLMKRLNRRYKNIRDIKVVHKTPAEIGGVFELFGTYGIKAHAEKRLLFRIWLFIHKHCKNSRRYHMTKHKPITCPQCGHKYPVAEGSCRWPHMRNVFDIVYCPKCNKDYRI